MSHIQPLSVIRKSHVEKVMRHAKGDLEEASQILGVAVEELRQFLIANDMYAVQDSSGPLATFEEE
ncbi:hypothetical protein AAU61_11665 [Desulfocarbo indianensis]|nr:hypothetical protein AAU61_11665 [Desulfocarbo indianensis]